MMAEKRNRYIFNFLMVLLLAVIIIPLMASCGKSSDGTVNTYNSQLVVANLSQDVGPVDLYINNNIQNGTSPYRYPLLGSYFYLNTIGYQMQIRANGGIKSTLLTTDSIPKRNAKYTLFI